MRGRMHASETLLLIWEDSGIDHTTSKEDKANIYAT